MVSGDPEKILAMLRDPNVESQDIAAAAGVPREEAARAARLVLGMAKAKPEEVVSLAPALALAAARAALAVGRGDVLAALAAHPSRDVAKEGRRGLHVLKSRGVRVPEPSRPAATPAVAVAPEPPFPCFASALDGQGERAIWITRAIPGKGVEVGQAVTSDVQGLLELQVALLGRKEFRGFARTLVERGRGMALAEIDRDEAKSLVAAARRLNEASGRRVPEGADAWLAKLGPASPPPDLAARFEPLPDAEEREAVDASAGLLDLPVLRGWLADEDVLRALAHKLDEIAVSPVLVDERQRAEQSSRAIADAIEAYLEPPRRERLAGRLFATAAHLERAGDPASARRAAATARAIAAGAPASRIPFVRQLVERAFAPHEEAPVPPAPKRTAGGLIVPPGGPARAD